MSNLHGKKIAAIFGAVVALGSIGAGLCIDYFVIETAIDLHTQTHHKSDLWGWISISIIALLFVRSLGRQGPRGVMGQITNPIHS
jgi:hypothetical protein